VSAVHDNSDKTRETFLISSPPSVSRSWNWNRVRRAPSAVCTTLPLHTRRPPSRASTASSTHRPSPTHLPTGVLDVYSNRSYIARCRTVGISFRDVGVRVYLHIRSKLFAVFTGRRNDEGGGGRCFWTTCDAQEV